MWKRGSRAGTWRGRQKGAVTSSKALDDAPGHVEQFNGDIKSVDLMAEGAITAAPQGAEAPRVGRDKFYLVSLAEALSRAVPDTDCRVIL
jgi:hypothetical protein